jgi:hypothetical protein
LRLDSTPGEATRLLVASAAVRPYSFSVALAIALLPLDAWAQSVPLPPGRADWSLVTRNNEVTYYMDIYTIRDSGGLRRAWELNDFRQRRYNGGLSLRSFWEADCGQKRRRYLQITFFSDSLAQGTVISALNLTSEWENVAPGTAGEVLLRAACSRF